MEKMLQNLNVWATANPGLSVVIGIIGTLASLASLLPIIAPAAIAVVDRARGKGNLTGDWLLVIYNEKRPFKVDSYRIKQLGRRLWGKIERIYSAEDREQVKKRKYDFSGYYRDGEIVYAFSPRDQEIHSYGCCNLKRSNDGEYTGFYHAPIGKNRKGKKYSILLTKKPARVAELQKIIRQEKPNGAASPHQLGDNATSPTAPSSNIAG